MIKWLKSKFSSKREKPAPEPLRATIRVTRVSADTPQVPPRRLPEQPSFRVPDSRPGPTHSRYASAPRDDSSANVSTGDAIFLMTPTSRHTGFSGIDDRCSTSSYSSDPSGSYDSGSSDSGSSCSSD